MARLPNKITYKFYGIGIPKARAIKYLTLRLRTQELHVEKGSLMMTFTGRKQQHSGILLLKLLCWIHGFCSAKGQWVNTVEETEAN